MGRGSVCCIGDPYRTNCRSPCRSPGFAEIAIPSDRPAAGEIPIGAARA